MNQTQIETILEAALFAAAEPLTVAQLEQMINKEERPERDKINAALESLMAHYESRGVQLVRVASGYHFVTHPDAAHYMQRLLERKPPRYSRALLETLALVIYRQPITRGEIEQVRGVAVSTNIIRTLMDREWVTVVGHKPVPGQPALYATTKQLLDYFNVQRISDLPPLSDLVDLDDMGEQLSKQLALHVPEQQEDVSAQLLQADDAETVDDVHDEAVIAEASDEIMAEETEFEEVESEEIESEDAIVQQEQETARESDEEAEELLA
jgi:segregation and condensation protein B